MWSGAKVGPEDPDFATNRAAMLAAIDALRALEARAENKSEERRARFLERGQITPRERLARLLDPGVAVSQVAFAGRVSGG